MSLSTILQKLSSGAIKNALTGAGLTLGTAAISMTAINTAITTFKSNIGSAPTNVLSLAHIAGFDYFISIILGAIVARHMLQSSNITVKAMRP